MPIPALVGAAIISSAASTGTAAMQNSSNNKRALANAQLERQWQLEDRLHDEQYNSPAAQLGRLRDAGINPLLSGGAPNVEQVPTQSNTVDGPVNVPQTDMGALVGSSFTNLASASDLELRKEELEVAKKKAESEIKKTDSDIEVNNSVKDLNEKLGAKTEAETNAIGEQFKRLVTENTYLDEKLRNDLKLQGIDINSKQLAYKFDYDTFNDRMENLRASNEKIWEEIKEIGSRIGLNKQMQKYWYSKTKELNELLANHFPYWQAVSMKNEALKGGIAYKSMILAYQYDLDLSPVNRMIGQYQLKNNIYDSWQKENNAFMTDFNANDPNSYIQGSLGTIDRVSNIAGNIGKLGIGLYGIKNMSQGKPFIGNFNHNNYGSDVNSFINSSVNRFYKPGANTSSTGGSYPYDVMFNTYGHAK